MKEAEESMAFNPVEFGREVKREMLKVTWPTRKETVVTTGMIIVMAIVAAIFFFFADWIIAAAVRLILNLPGQG
jgi:preprotein translocase subunit SecE